jgi:hypothetical protein
MSKASAGLQIAKLYPFLHASFGKPTPRTSTPDREEAGR